MQKVARPEPKKSEVEKRPGNKPGVPSGGPVPAAEGVQAKTCPCGGGCPRCQGANAGALGKPGNRGHIAFRLADPPSNPPPGETSADRAAANAVAEAAPYGIVIEDGLPPGPGQVNRTDFIEKVAPMIEQTAAEMLTPAGRDVRDCPYLEFWLSFYRRQSASHIERAIERYVQPSQPTLDGIETAILARVRRAVQAWVDRREVQLPKEVDWRVDDDRLGDKRGGVAAAQLMGAGGDGAAAPPGSAASIRGRLSEGRPLEPTVRSRMERGFGASFRDVRLHDDNRADSVARDYRARAFTVGQDIGFAAGHYRPGTMAGDLLLAHEIAHTIQQRSATVEGPAEDLEADATLSAIGAMMPESGVEAKPAMHGGLGTPLRVWRRAVPERSLRHRIQTDSGRTSATLRPQEGH